MVTHWPAALRFSPPLGTLEYHTSSDRLTKRNLQLPTAARLSSPLSSTARRQRRGLARAWAFDVSSHH